MRIHFEIREKLPEIIEEILNCERWTTLVKEDISGRKLVVIRDPNYNSEATVEIYAREITIRRHGQTTRIACLFWVIMFGVSTMVLIADCWNKIYCLPSLPGKVCWNLRYWIALCTGVKRGNSESMLKTI